MPDILTPVPAADRCPRNLPDGAHMMKPTALSAVRSCAHCGARDTGPLVVIPCAAKKLDRPAPAGELYQGSYHRACRQTADALTADGGTVVVLSALHGLLTLDRVIEPYELRMGDPGTVLPVRLRQQARELGLANAPTVVVLAGAAYVYAARQVWPDASAPLTGRGIGRQLQRLAELRDPALFPLT